MVRAPRPWGGRISRLTGRIHHRDTEFMELNGGVRILPTTRLSLPILRGRTHLRMGRISRLNLRYWGGRIKGKSMPRPFVGMTGHVL